MWIFILSWCAAEDNRRMNKERDLLPWIFGGLSAAAIAVAFAAVSTHRDAPTLAPQVAATQAAAAPPALPALPAQPAQPLAMTAQAAPPATPPDSAPPPPQTQTALAPDVQAGQIWECVTKGVKTFSNNPCGEKSTLLDVGPINTMPPAPTTYARAYGSDRRYGAGYPDQSASADDDEYYSDSDSADTGGNSYSTVLGVGLLARRRQQHSHHPYAPPASAPPPAHHNSSGPVRRY
jgi:hypothetical protein